MAQTDNKQRILLESGTNEVEFLIINVGPQAYGVNVAKVRTIQVFDPAQLALLPNQHAEVLGVMPFREKTISVLDLAINLNVPSATAEGAKRLLIVAEFNTRLTGFVVDAVEGIHRCSWAQFEPITDASCNSVDGGVIGTVRRNNVLVIILDLESIIAKLDPTMSVEHFANEIEPTVSAHRETLKVVHCDDSGIIQKLVGKVLTQAGFKHLKQFNNGEETLAYLQSEGAGQVDVVLSDIEMPKMDGLTLCRKLKEDRNLSKVPVLFFSSMINDQMLEKCRSVGGAHAYSKPEIHHLVDGIESICTLKNE